MAFTPGLDARQATIADLDLLTPMFDAYRQFYRKPPDLDLARRFLFERFQHNQSIIFLAFKENGAPVGFTLLGRLTLSTEVSNEASPALYEAEGWKLQTDFCVYNMPLD